MKLKSYILSALLTRKIQSFSTKAFLALLTTLNVGCMYAAEKNLNGGGTDSWIVQCSGFWCDAGGSANYDTLNIKNGDNTGNFTFTNLQFKTNNFGGEMGLKINAAPDTGKITINNLFTSHTGAVGFNASLEINANTYIQNITHDNRGGGTALNVTIGGGTNHAAPYTKNLDVDKISFSQNGLSGSQGKINLKAKDITIKTAAGRLSQILNVEVDGNITANDIYFDGISGVGGFAVIPKSEINFNAKNGSFTSQSVKGMGHSNIVIKAKDKITIDNVGFAVDICITAACVGLIHLESENDIIVKSVSGGTNDESGIGSFNTLKVKGKNFYAGKVEAISLATALNNSYLDLSEVSGTTFIDDLYFRNGTLKADNFHFNNFSVRKANANRVGFEHPTDGSAYTRVEGNIGKSFLTISLWK